MNFVSGRVNRSPTTLTIPNPSAPDESMNAGAIIKT